MRSHSLPRPSADPAANPNAASPAAASKTRRKHHMHALQDLGVERVALDPKRLGTLDLPEPLVDAIALARKLTQHEARRRQMQFIGRLMRDVDPAPLREALAAWAQGSQRERARGAAPRNSRALFRALKRIIDERASRSAAS